MVGSWHSLLQLLKQKNPYLTNTHCINHRLALASSSLIEEIPYLIEYIEVLSDIHSFFNKSAKRTAMLKEGQLIFDEDELRMVRLCPTRWLSLRTCVDHVLRGMQSVVLALNEESMNKKLTLYERNRIALLSESVCTYKFIGVTYFLHDILGITENLCKMFQKEECCINQRVIWTLALKLTWRLQ
jgi:hypothetical protein